MTRDTSSLWNEALSIQSENAEIARLHDDMARLEDGVARLGKEMSCLNLTVSRAAASIRCAAWVTAAACALAVLLAVLRRY